MGLRGKTFSLAAAKVSLLKKGERLAPDSSLHGLRKKLKRRDFG
jgi:hypothetical protein